MSIARYHLKHQMSCLGDQEFEVTIDREHREVHVRVETLDTSLLSWLVIGVLPADHDVVAFRDDNQVDGEASLTSPTHYRLVVEFGAELYGAEVVKLFSIGGRSEVSVVLEDPAKERARRCRETATDVLRALHENGIDARAVGSIANGGQLHKGSDVDLLVMNREDACCLGRSDAKAVLGSRQWRAPLDVSYANWFADCGAVASFEHLVWSESAGKLLKVFNGQIERGGSKP